MTNPTPTAPRRRQFLEAAGLLALRPGATAGTGQSLDAFPAHPVEMVREMVTVAHGNLQRVKELVEARPALANAAIEWGFGDWEDALGAASHVGNREIAEYLIAKGARPSLFSATMLGQLETVKAFVAAQPGVQRIAGPHSISLLAHAQAGGKQAEGVLRFLESLGDAGSPQRPPLSADDAQSLAGEYEFGPGPTDRIEITAKGAQLTFVRKGTSGRRLMHLGGYEFHPAGASAARIKFSRSGSTVTLTVHDPEPLLTARRAL